eukprot:INCI16415.2.p1 GENE.INCI16415.2~~INCI16415.2.p1  ORF type:complete len:2447 (+),score=457.87 INCI16415.2:185-7525(+)
MRTGHFGQFEKTLRTRNVRRNGRTKRLERCATPLSDAERLAADPRCLPQILREREERRRLGLDPSAILPAPTGQGEGGVKLPRIHAHTGRRASEPRQSLTSDQRSEGSASAAGSTSESTVAAKEVTSPMRFKFWSSSPSTPSLSPTKSRSQRPGAVTKLPQIRSPVSSQKPAASTLPKPIRRRSSSSSPSRASQSPTRLRKRPSVAAQGLTPLHPSSSPLPSPTRNSKAAGSSPRAMSQPAPLDKPNKAKKHGNLSSKTLPSKTKKKDNSSRKLRFNRLSSEFVEAAQSILEDIAVPFKRFDSELQQRVVMGDKVRLVVDFVLQNLECPSDVQLSLLQKLQWQVSLQGMEISDAEIASCLSLMDMLNSHKMAALSDTPPRASLAEPQATMSRRPQNASIVGKRTLASEQTGSSVADPDSITRSPATELQTSVVPSTSERVLLDALRSGLMTPHQVEMAREALHAQRKELGLEVEEYPLLYDVIQSKTPIELNDVDGSEHGGAIIEDDKNVDPQSDTKVTGDLVLLGQDSSSSAKAIPSSNSSQQVAEVAASAENAHDGGESALAQVDAIRPSTADLVQEALAAAAAEKDEELSDEERSHGENEVVICTTDDPNDPDPSTDTIPVVTQENSNHVHVDVPMSPSRTVKQVHENRTENKRTVPKTTSRQLLFREGDVVEANFGAEGSFFPGKIAAVSSSVDRTYDIAYHDGDFEVAVPEHCIRQQHHRDSPAAKRSAFQVGDVVEADFGAEGAYFPGKIAFLRPHQDSFTYQIVFEDGDSESNVPESRIRFPEKKELLQQASDSFQVGDTIEADFGSEGTYFPGKIAGVHKDNETCEILYDDGDTETAVPIARIRRRQTSGLNNAVEPFHVGDIVEADFNAEGTFFRGQITNTNENGTFCINYDDGDSEMDVPSARIRRYNAGLSGDAASLNAVKELEQLTQASAIGSEAAQWLRDHGFDAHIPRFANEGISSFEIMRDLQEHHLVEMGFRIGERIRFFQLLREALGNGENSADESSDDEADLPKPPPMPREMVEQKASELQELAASQDDPIKQSQMKQAIRRLSESGDLEAVLAVQRERQERMQKWLAVMRMVRVGRGFLARRRARKLKVAKKSAELMQLAADPERKTQMQKAVQALSASGDLEDVLAHQRQKQEDMKRFLATLQLIRLGRGFIARRRVRKKREAIASKSNELMQLAADPARKSQMNEAVRRLSESGELQLVLQHQKERQAQMVKWLATMRLIRLGRGFIARRRVRKRREVIAAKSAELEQLAANPETKSQMQEAVRRLSESGDLQAVLAHQRQRQETMKRWLATMRLIRMGRGFLARRKVKKLKEVTATKASELMQLAADPSKKSQMNDAIRRLSESGDLEAVLRHQRQKQLEMKKWLATMLVIRLGRGFIARRRVKKMREAKAAAAARADELLELAKDPLKKSQMDEAVRRLSESGDLEAVLSHQKKRQTEMKKWLATLLVIRIGRGFIARRRVQRMKAATAAKATELVQLASDPAKRSQMDDAVQRLSESGELEAVLAHQKKRQAEMKKWLATMLVIRIGRGFMARQRVRRMKKAKEAGATPDEVFAVGRTGSNNQVDDAKENSPHKALRAALDQGPVSATSIRELFAASDTSTDALSTLNERSAENGATPLLTAAQFKSEDAIEALLGLKADPMIKGLDGSTPAEVAVFGGLTKGVRALLGAKVDPNTTRGDDGNSLLMLAAYAGHFEVLSELVSHGGHDLEHVVNAEGLSVKSIVADVHGKFLFQVGLPDAEGLHVAAENDEPEIVQRCLDLKTNVDCSNEEGLAAISLAAYFNSTQAISVLAAAKANPNTCGHDGTSPLILAVHQGNVESVRALVDAFSCDEDESGNNLPAAAGGNQDLDFAYRLNGDCTALYLACQEGLVDAVEALTSTKAGRKALEVSKKSGASPLYIAAHEGHLACVEVLLRAKADVGHTVRGGITPLYIAVQKNHANVVGALLAAKADPQQATEEKNTTALTIAVFHCNAVIVRQLLDAGAIVDCAGGSGADENTVAMLAAYSLDVDILGHLLLHGASLNLRNTAGYTIDNVLRNTHGLRLLSVVFHCLGQHDEIIALSNDESIDAEGIRDLFDRIDANGDQVITKEELHDALEAWGCTSKYGKSFGVFVDSEFRRLDQDQSGSVSVSEFRACYGRFHLLYRSQQSRVPDLQETEVSAPLPGTTPSSAGAEKFPHDLPQWMRNQSVEATSCVWGAFQQGQVMQTVNPPVNWFSYVLRNFESTSSHDPSRLMSRYGFDVEEVSGFSDPVIADESESSGTGRILVANKANGRPTSATPLKNEKYLRISRVAENEREPGRLDGLRVGDIVMTFFGTDNEKCLRSRKAFVDLACKLPFVYVDVFRTTEFAEITMNDLKNKLAKLQPPGRVGFADQAAKNNSSEIANPLSVTFHAGDLVDADFGGEGTFFSRCGSSCTKRWDI